MQCRAECGDCAAGEIATREALWQAIVPPDPISAVRRSGVVLIGGGSLCPGADFTLNRPEWVGDLLFAVTRSAIIQTGGCGEDEKWRYDAAANRARIKLDVDRRRERQREILTIRRARAA